MTCSSRLLPAVHYYATASAEFVRDPRKPQRDTMTVVVQEAGEKSPELKFIAKMPALWSTLHR